MSYEIEQIRSTSAVVEDFVAEVIEATRRAEETYEDFNVEDATTVLRYRADLYDEYGVEGLHPRNRETGINPPDGAFEVTDDGSLIRTNIASFNFDMGFVTGLFHGRNIDDEQMADVFQAVANTLEKGGFESIRN